MIRINKVKRHRLEESMEDLLLKLDEILFDVDGNFFVLLYSRDLNLGMEILTRRPEIDLLCSRENGSTVIKKI